MKEKNSLNKFLRLLHKSAASNNKSETSLVMSALLGNFIQVANILKSEVQEENEELVAFIQELIESDVSIGLIFQFLPTELSGNYLRIAEIASRLEIDRRISFADFMMLLLMLGLLTRTAYGDAIVSE